MKNIMGICLLGFSALVSNAAYADCRSVFNEIKTVAERAPGSPDDDGKDYVFVYSYNKVRWEGIAHGGHSNGQLWIANDGHLTSNNAWTYTQGYSDYPADAIKRVGDGIFDFYPDGRMTLRLPEWGNGTIDVQNATCYSDSFGHYVTGMRRENNGTATVGITFRKQTTLY